MSRLLKIKKNWYLLDMKVNPVEGSVVSFNDYWVGYATFVDVENSVCIINNGAEPLSVEFSDIESVVASSNKSDGTPMLNLKKIENLILDKFIFNLPYKPKFGVLYPNDDMSVIGYYATKENCFEVLRNWFISEKIKILEFNEYVCSYTIIVKELIKTPWVDPKDNCVEVVKIVT